MSHHGNSNQKAIQFRGGQPQQRQAFYGYRQPLPPLPPPPTQQDAYSNQSQGPPSHVTVQSGQSYSNSNDQPQGRYVWIPH